MLHAFPPPNFWVLHLDGSAQPNPGRMAWGVVLRSPGGELHSASGVGGGGCNNEAELLALQQGLELAHVHGAASLRIYTDSQWLVAQCQASAGVRRTERLARALAPVQALLRPFDAVTWRWIPRHHNTQADALARQAHAQGH